ncbi:MAG TPA: chemotaxis protein CheW [Spirochaetales bacterium]|nr:chemotaxis protein CheW [Spirochaetales bacterium]
MANAVITEVTQYLTFKLGEEIFGVDVSQVQEILEMTSITKIPQTPPFMKGVINVRGKVVPVVDLRLKFGMEAADNTVDTCTVVVEVVMEGETIVLGAVADSVDEVIDQQPDQIEPPPKIGTNLNTEFIKGMGKRDDRFIIILDINKIFTTEDIAIIREVERTAPGANAAK